MALAVCSGLIEAFASAAPYLFHTEWSIGFSLIAVSKNPAALTKSLLMNCMTPSAVRTWVSDGFKWLASLNASSTSSRVNISALFNN